MTLKQEPCDKLILTFCLFLRSSLYPAGSAGHRPGWSPDEEVEPFGQRCQQVVHRRHPDLRVLLHAAVAHRLPNTEGRRDLSSEVVAPPAYMQLQ